MNLFVQLLIEGLAAGGLYAVIGVSLGIIFNVTRVFHFAHGAIFALGAYATYFLVARLGLPLLLAVVPAAALCVVAGLACELLIYRPLRRRGSTPLLGFLASFALLIIVQNTFLLFLGGEPMTLAGGAARTFMIGGFRLSELALCKMAAGIGVAALVWIALKTTLVGKQLRAIVSNAEMARVAGVDLDRSYLWAYAIGSALTVPAAAIALFDQGVSPSLSETPLLIGTVSVFAGGLGVMLGGAVGGLVLGLISSLSVYWFAATFQDTVALGAMTLFLLLRPAGLLGVRMRRV